MTSHETQADAAGIRPKTKSTIIPRRKNSGLTLQRQTKDPSTLEPEINESPRTTSKIGSVFGVWLSSVFLLSLIGRNFIGHGVGIQLLLGGAICWTSVYFLFSKKHRFIPRGLPIDAALALTGFLFFAAVSIIVSQDWATSAIYFSTTVLAIFIAMQFSSSMVAGDFERGLKIYACISMLALAWFAMTGHASGVRLGNATGIMNPNALALVAMSVVVSAMVIRTQIIRYAVAAVAAFVLYLTGSRTAAVTTVIALSIIFFYRTRQAKSQQKMMVAVAVMFSLVLVALFMEGLQKGAEEFFAVNDPLRGVGSGATGRVEAWTQAWGLFTSNPITGVGYRAHGMLMDGFSSAHNGYLALLAEVGLISFISVIYLIYSGIMAVKKQLEHPVNKWTAVVLFSYSTAFAFEAFFERFLINFGNPASLLLLIIMLRAYRTTAVRRQPPAIGATGMSQT